MSDDAALRAHLRRILDWEDAHAGFDRAVAGLPARLRGVTPTGWEHSAWQLLEGPGLAAADLSTRSDRAAMLGRLQTALAALGTVDGSIGDMVEADLAFHRLLCELTGNATLVRAWETHRPDPGGDPVPRPGNGVGQHVRRPPPAAPRRDRRRRPGLRSKRGRRAHARGCPHAARRR